MPPFRGGSAGGTFAALERADPVTIAPKSPDPSQPSHTRRKDALHIDERITDVSDSLDGLHVPGLSRVETPPAWVVTIGTMTWVNSMLDLSSDLPTVEVAPGEVLIEEGMTRGRLWVLVSGAVEIEREGVAFARVDVPGAVLGEMSALLERPASASVRAATPVTVRVSDDPNAFLRDRPGAALEILRTTASRLDGMTQYLVDVKRQYAEAEGHLGMVDRILGTLLHHQSPPASPGSRRDPEGDAHGSHEGQNL